ncbi:MAG: type II secretion system protein GspK [Thermodesulfobacteriota bacterium]|nr:type II secretion system protein GspK [Thermodesulfobacteriota bacterium]
MGRSLKPRGLFGNDSGFALILTILIISLIVALTLQFNTYMRSDLDAASNFRDGVSLACIARSGFDCALAVLSQDASESEFDSLHEDWAHSKVLSANSAPLFSGGRFEVGILDHSGKIQINRLVDGKGRYNTKQKDLLTRFLSLEQFDLDPEEVDSLLDCLKDWFDPDNEVTGFGAENNYYQALDGPYACKNAPIEFPQELLSIRGITRKLYYGTEDKLGISAYLTVHGDGKININTADILVLRALAPEIDQEMAEDMATYREDGGNDLSASTWYKSVPGLDHVTIDPDLATTSTTYFEIKSEGFKDSMSQGISGMVVRKEGALRILSWKKE